MLEIIKWEEGIKSNRPASSCHHLPRNSDAHSIAPLSGSPQYPISEMRARHENRDIPEENIAVHKEMVSSGQATTYKRNRLRDPCALRAVLEYMK